METKVCCRCGRELPRTREYFHKLSRTRDGFYYYCKECAGYSFGKPWTKKTVTNNGIKKCTKCGRELPLEMFTKLSRTYDGYHCNCKDCLNKHRKQYRDKNQKYLMNKFREYRKNKGETLNARRRQIYRESEDKRDRCTIEKEKRRSLKNKLDATLTKNQWIVIKEIFNNNCAYCGKEKPLQQDHFIALSNSGEYTHNNIIPACKNCNASKNDTDFFKWYPNQENYSPKREKAILKFLGYDKQGTMQQPMLLI